MWRNHRLRTYKIKWKSKCICKYMGSTVTHGISSVKYCRNKKKALMTLNRSYSMHKCFLFICPAWCHSYCVKLMVPRFFKKTVHLHISVQKCLSIWPALSWQINWALLLHSPFLTEFGPWGFMNDVLQISPVPYAVSVCHEDGKQDGSAHASGKPCEFILNTCR